MASKGIVNRPMQRPNIFILLFEIFFLSLLRIDVISFFFQYTTPVPFFSPYVCALRVVSFDDGHVFDPLPLSMYPMSFVRPYRLASLLNLMTRHDHGFPFCVIFFPTAA